MVITYNQPFKSNLLLLRLRGLRDILRIGHCAPAVMQTLLKSRGVEDEQMLLTVSGMGGGIGQSAAECGCVTSSISTLGLMFGDEVNDNGIPRAIAIGQRFLRRFEAVNRGILCKEITPDKSAFRPCLKAMCSTPAILMKLVDELPYADDATVDTEKTDANKKLLDHFSGCDFHCAQTVLKELGNDLNIDNEVLNSSYGFIGGTVLKGMTCSALVAGIHAIGLKYGGIESSFLRVLKLTGLFMFNSENTMRDNTNKANRAMNISYMLALRFEDKFSSTMCRDIVQVGFSTRADVDKYVSENTMDRCLQITKFVVKNVREMLDETTTQNVPIKVWAHQQ